MSSPVPKIIMKDNKHYIKIDYGRYFYESEIYKNIFTSEIINPIDLVQKAIENFSTSTYNVSYSFDTMCENSNGVLEIVINIKNEIIIETKQFSIPMIYYVKNENDIINERFYQLEDTIKELKNENQTLKNEMKSILKNLNKKETVINTDTEQSDTSDSSESTRVPIKKQLISKRKLRNVI
jgi:hypothetical protein